MTKINFVFSAFLKVLSLNEKPQRREIRSRLAPSAGSGFDFHKSMRECARRYLVHGEPLASVAASTAAITRLPERQSAAAALERLGSWRERTSGEIVNIGTAIYESPRHLFRVRFEPVFGLRAHGRVTAYTIWNNKSPLLAVAPSYAALSLAAEAYHIQGDDAIEVGFLSLREPVRCYSLSDAPARSALSASIVSHVEELILEERPTAVPHVEDRPTPL
mgnify:FL=1